MISNYNIIRNHIEYSWFYIIHIQHTVNNIICKS